MEQHETFGSYLMNQFLDFLTTAPAADIDESGFLGPDIDPVALTEAVDEQCETMQPEIDVLLYDDEEEMMAMPLFHSLEGMGAVTSEKWQKPEWKADEPPQPEKKKVVEFDDVMEMPLFASLEGQPEKWATQQYKGKKAPAGAAAKKGEVVEFDDVMEMPLFNSLEGQPEKWATAKGGGVPVPKAPSAPAAPKPAPVPKAPVVPKPPPKLTLEGPLPSSEDGVHTINPLTQSVDLIHPETYMPSISDLGGSSILKPLSHSIENVLQHDYSDIIGQCDLRFLRSYLHNYPGRRLRRVLKSDLEQCFRAKWQELKQKYPGEHERNMRRPRICFHGTKLNLVNKIVDTGLKVPDGKDVKHTCDSGWWGKGIYLSHDAAYSAGYSEDGGTLIVCVALLGKVFHCSQRRDGGVLEPGYDSHVAEGGSEWVVFESSQVLPLFVLEDRNKPLPEEAAPVPAAAAKKVEKPGPKKKPPPPDATIPCPWPLCEKMFKTQMAVNCHCNNTGHAKDFRRCDRCLKVLKTPDGLIQHMKAKNCEQMVNPWVQVGKGPLSKKK